MNYCRRLLAVINLVVFSLAVPVTGAELPDYKKTRQQLYLTAAQAHAKKQAEGGRVALIDVRSRAEIAFVGMPDDADANVPYKNVDFDTLDRDSGSFAMVPNPEFSASVEKVLAAMGLDKHQPIMLMCRSGGRSAAAADLLAGQGYTRVYSVTDGFEGDEAKSGPHKGLRRVNGWKNAGAPWSRHLSAEKLY